MKISVVSGAPETRSADLIAYALFAPAAEAPTKSGAAKKATRKAKRGLTGALSDADAALGGVISLAMEAEGFTGAAGQTLSIHTHGKIAAPRILVLGAGGPEKFAVDSYRKLAGQAVKAGAAAKAKRVVIVLPEEGARLEARIEAAAEGAQLATYRFQKYLTQNAEASTVTDVELAVSERTRAETALHRAGAVSTGVAYARDLVNEPPCELTPVRFAQHAVDAGKKYGFKTTVLDEKAIEKERMGLVLAVSKAATPYTPPRVVKMSYKPAKKAKKHIVLVGKGLTFDSGGLDIKPADGMLDMKVDMSGAAAVLGTMIAIAQIKPDVAVTGYLGCVENGIGGNAYHPGDIIKSRKGLTVEINNTDAEGRLVLADCIDLAITEENPDVLIDLATLTGACMVALGPNTAGIFTEDDALAEDIRTIGRRAGEDFWRLPLNEELFSQLKSPIADMKNTGLRFGGAITAALFLSKFVAGRVKWAHLDIAGPADTDKDSEYTTRGGVGFGVRTLVGVIDPR
jgi:leucyl aminopeptidase